MAEMWSVRKDQCCASFCVKKFEKFPLIVPFFENGSINFYGGSKKWYIFAITEKTVAQMLTKVETPSGSKYSRCTCVKELDFLLELKFPNRSEFGGRSQIYISMIRS